MPYEFKLPDLGEGLTEGEIARWLVTEGQEVAEDDPLVEIQTDKTTVEIPSPAAGKVASILVEEGQVVPVGTVLVVIGEGAVAEVEQVAGAEPRTPGPGPGAGPVGQGAGARVQATPLVRRIAEELGVDLGTLAGSAPGGRITEEDVRTAAGGGAKEGRREPVRGVRRLIVESMTRSHREIPAVTWVEECDFTGVDLKLLLPLVLRATARSLQVFPELNARLEGDEIVYFDRFDIGVAMQTEQGLLVPVVRRCEDRSVDELRLEIERLAEGAQAGTLKPEELRDGTFTVTSAGKAAGLLVTPLIHHPEVGILGVHRIAERAVVRGGEVGVRRMGNISVTFDHRVVDGKRAADFGLAVIAELESGTSRA